MLFILSILTYKHSKKIGNIDKTLKKYQIEEIKKKREEEKKSCVEARVIKVETNKWKMEFVNSGKPTVYNVDFEIDAKYGRVVRKDKVPYEILESGQSFREIMPITNDSPERCGITIFWEDKDGKKETRKQYMDI